MADMKTLDAKKITERFAEKADELQHDLQRAARNAIDEVRLVAATLKELPPSSSELLTQAVVARVGEFDMKENGATPGTGTVRVGQVRFDPWGGSILDGDSVIPAGKYRALFFLVPVKR